MEGRPASAGAILRRGRLDRGLSLSDLGEALHVPARYIHAIETDDYAALPPTVYTRALIREYARYVGINPADVLDRFVPMRPADRNPIRPALQPIERSPLAVSWKAIGIAAGMVLCVGLFAYLYAQYNSFAESIEAGRGQTADLRPTPAGRSAAVRITPFIVTPDTPTPLPPPTATPAAPLVVEARVTEPSWIQVWTDGRQNPGEAVPAGATRLFLADQSIRMRVGNAGGVDITVNGTHQGKLGAQNQAVEASWGRE